MRYVSTRGGAPPVGFADAMIAGLAPDGGLYVPEELPAVDLAAIRSWSGLAYAELAAEVISLFAPDMERASIDEACRAAYSATIFGSDEIVPSVALTEDTWLLQLSNGPTLAFKDMAMQLLGRLFDAELTRRGERLLVVGATSGDTGSSAEHAMIGRHNIGVVMLSPWERVSPFQAAQMYSLDEPNIVNLAIRGVFDEAQDLVKAVNADAEFKAKHSIGAVNSINWARVAAQIVYYIWAWLRVATPPEGEIQIAVPTGNFGNIYAGIVARRLGLPIRFILATNENDVLDEFFRTGVYRVRPNDQVAETSSPSMDIAKASNFERFVFDLHEGDGAAVGQLWSQLNETGQFDLSSHPGFAAVSDWLISGSSTHENRIQTIRRVAASDGVLLDPHTADGLYVGRKLRGRGTLVCLETAQSTKFEGTIDEALGQTPPRPEHLVGLEDRPQQVTVIEADIRAVRSEVERLTVRQSA